MTLNRLLTAAAALALVSGLAPTALAQTKATAKTEAQAKAATGKPTSDAPANTAVQGTAKAVKEGVAPAAAAAATPATATQAAAVDVKPAGDLVETLRASGKFTAFLKAADSTNLTGLLKTNKNLTVFAPTDAAFGAMPPAELARLQADKAAMQKFVLHHIVNAPVDSSKIKGARGPVPTGAGDQLLLDGSDESGALKADGATIVQADVRTGSGLLQVVDHVLQAGAAGSASAAASGAAAPASATAPAEPAAKPAAKPK